MVRKFSIVFAAAGIIAAGLLPARAATRSVEIVGNAFRPDRLTISVGDVVRWTNTDNKMHSVSANSSAIAQGESFESGSRCPPGLLGGNNCLRSGETFEHTFTREGTFTYRCRIHGSNTSFAACEMCGQIIVRAASAPPTTPPPSTPRPPLSASPTTSGSPTQSPSLSPTPTGSSPLASGSTPGGEIPVVPIALGAVVLLGGSGWVVYRVYLKG